MQKNYFLIKKPSKTNNVTARYLRFSWLACWQLFDLSKVPSSSSHRYNVSQAINILSWFWNTVFFCRDSHYKTKPCYTKTILNGFALFCNDDNKSLAMQFLLSNHDMRDVDGYVFPKNSQNNLLFDEIFHRLYFNSIQWPKQYRKNHALNNYNLQNQNYIIAIIIYNYIN